MKRDLLDVVTVACIVFVLMVFVFWLLAVMGGRV